MADPVVGPADDATRKRELARRQAENAKGDTTYQRSPPPRQQQPQGVPISGRDRRNAVDSVVEHAIRSGDPRPSYYPNK